MVGGFSHETNMFNPFPTGLDEFILRGVLSGSEILTKLQGTNTEIGGSAGFCAENGISIVPSVVAHAMPAGIVTDDAADSILQAFLDTLERNVVDGILLHLHGAMVVENHDDGEGWLLGEIRSFVGKDLPIVVTLDLHATLTPEMIEHADAITIYRTYPHMDMADRGREAAGILLQTMNGKIHPVMALAKPPLLIGPPHNVLPTDMPMKLVYDRARWYEASDLKVIAACPAHGFIQQDVPHGGAGIVVTADGDFEVAQKAADDLAEMMFANRHGYIVDLPDPEETIRLAMNSDIPPVAIADSGDNIGGGTPGDGTALLEEILRQGVDTAFVPLYDPEAAKIAADAGVGATVTLSVGGKSHPLYGPPVTVTGVVSTVHNGLFMNRAEYGYKAGVFENMGLTVRLDVEGITIMLNSIPTSPNNLMHAKSVGIFPEDYRMIVCKGGLAFREAYKPPVVNTYIQSDTPGFSSSNLSNFNFTQIRRPLFPLDDI